MAEASLSNMTSPTVQAAATCPFDHAGFSQQKTARVVEATGQAVHKDAAGVWHVRDYAAARTVLRSSDTRQAGFKAELVERIPGQTNMPVLFQEGQTHHQQRKQTARFFTPKAVSEHYRALMETLADQMIARFRRKKQVDISKLSMSLAVKVAGEVVGLTNSRLPGMDQRLNAFFAGNAGAFRRTPRAVWNALMSQARVLAFFAIDVKPAIQARRRVAKEDVISHLIAQGYSDSEILTECITFGAAGMATTREFITIAAWHLLEQPALRQRFIAADEAERLEILQEILRLEPVIGNLYRRATADIEVDAGGVPVTIPKGALINIHIYATNADEAVVGDYPLMICPKRPLGAERVGPAMMSFGDGHHRCPGAYIALQESDIFLQRLMSLPGLHIVQKPSVSWNDIINGYELRHFILGIA
ncbi:MAG: cytochrome P450 [Herpetosiphon sp.]